MFLKINEKKIWVGNTHGFRILLMNVFSWFTGSLIERIDHVCIESVWERKRQTEKPRDVQGHTWPPVSSCLASVSVDGKHCWCHAGLYSPRLVHSSRGDYGPPRSPALAHCHAVQTWGNIQRKLTSAHSSVQCLSVFLLCFGSPSVCYCFLFPPTLFH